MSKKFTAIIALVLMFSHAVGQPFSLKSTGGEKPFRLDIYYGTEGKGAFVQYRGQQGIIPLAMKARTSEEKTAPSKATYVWDEIIGGKITGSYGLTQDMGKLSKAWYKRAKDGKLFHLEQIHEPIGNRRVHKYLVHGVLISFRTTASDNLLSLLYPDGSRQTSLLPDFDHPDPQRQGTIADYNFDGYDDLAFSVPEAGMGVYRTFSIYLYNPTSKRFQILAEPDAPQAKCSGLCDVKLDQKNKLLISSCRGGATWWKDIYSFSHNNNLIWIRSSKQQ